MVELFKFILSDFWVFVGAVIIIGVTLDGIADIIKAIRKQHGTMKKKDIQDFIFKPTFNRFEVYVMLPIIYYLVSILW